MMTGTPAKLDSCLGFFQDTIIFLPSNHPFNDLFCLFSRDVLHMLPIDMVSSRSILSLLPQYLICCPRAVTSWQWKGLFLTSCHILPRHPRHFPAVPLLRLSTVPRLFRLWMCLPGLTSLFVAAFDLVLHCFVLCSPLCLLYKSQLFFHLNQRLCCTTYVSVVFFTKILLKSGSTTAKQSVKSFWLNIVFK